ncbi:hypothetical protein [Paracoccus mutanolyticus]|uniref:hypothetical protein n=1 Tax=Paracoccus mutanolyticus TaxID=1499308 RepID=UPI0011AE26EE|nr:hypothetical protein [Paracoccus mutanolyticus]
MALTQPASLTRDADPRDRTIGKLNRRIVALSRNGSSWLDRRASGADGVDARRAAGCSRRAHRVILTPDYSDDPAASSTTDWRPWGSW